MVSGLPYLAMASFVGVVRHPQADFSTKSVFEGIAWPVRHSGRVMP